MRVPENPLSIRFWQGFQKAPESLEVPTGVGVTLLSPEIHQHVTETGNRLFPRGLTGDASRVKEGNLSELDRSYMIIVFLITI